MGTRSRFRRSRGHGTAGWQQGLAPLLDVLFLLLIFLLVSANFDESQVLEVQLPRATTGESAPPVAQAQRRIITLLADGSLRFNGTPITPEALTKDLASRPEAERLLTQAHGLLIRRGKAG